MKALTLWQPWASLIACGAKRFETRSWCRGLEVGDSLAIHAGAKCANPLELPRRDADAISLALPRMDWSLLPTRVVVCTGRVAGLWQSLGWTRDDGWHLDVCNRAGEHHVLDIGIPGVHFGNYDPGRWLIELAEVRPLLHPQPAKGKQGVWQWRETQHV